MKLILLSETQVASRSFKLDLTNIYQCAILIPVNGSPNRAAAFHKEY